GDHVGAGVAGLPHELVELDPRQEGQKEEQARAPRPQAVARSQVRGAAVGDGGAFRAGPGPRHTRRPPARARAANGGGSPAAQRTRNWWTCWRKASKE